LIPLLRALWPFGGRARTNRVLCRVLFVCMGNLCRSPSAEVVFRRKLQAAGLGEEVQCASAGTHDVFLGVQCDARARAAAQRRGYDMSGLRVRVVADEDFERFDLILAMDRQNLDALRERCPPQNAERLRLLMQFAHRHTALDIPDPYYGNAQAFELVLDMIEDSCESLLDYVRARYIVPEQAPGEAEAGPR
jgi:protein-tyrosine phosphatase